MTTEERLAALEADNATLKARLARLEGIERLLQVYALLGTRCRAIEEKVYTRAEAEAAAEYWSRAMAAIGIIPKAA